MVPADDLNEAVSAAQTATSVLLSVMVAHQITPGILNLRLTSMWPQPVQAAYAHWENQVTAIARILARQRGLTGGSTLSDTDRTALILRACVLAMDLDG